MNDFETRTSSNLALGVLVIVAVGSPWLFGAVQPWAILAITTTGLVVSAIALAAGVVRGGTARPAVPLWPLIGFAALGLLQLVPLPAAAHALAAPGTHTVWHPAEAAAVAVLGGGAHPVSLDPDSTLRSLSLVVALGLLAFLAAPALARPGPAVAAVTTVAAFGFLLSAYAIFARTHFGPLLYGRFVVPTVTPFGPFVSKNHFAGYVVMAALLAAGLAIGLAQDARRRHRDWTASPRAGVIVLVMVAALTMALAGLASLSRGGAIALFAGGASLLALVLCAREGRSRAGAAYVLVIAGVLGLVLVVLVPAATHARLQTLGGASFRLATWRDALRMSLTSPVVGHGLGAFHDAYPRFKREHGLIRVEHAENDYVETLAETGLVGLVLALAGGGLVLAGASRRLLSRSGPLAARGGTDPASTRSDFRHGLLVRGVGMGAVAGLIALAVHSAVDFNLRIPSKAALEAVLAAAAAGAAGLAKRPLLRPGGAALALGALALLAAVLALPAEPWVDALDEARRAGVAAIPEARALRLERADAALVRVLRRRPAHAESWLVLAGVRAVAGDAPIASALARHAVTLDPERPALTEAARVLER